MSSVQSDVGRQGKITAVAIVLACLAGGYIAVTWLSGSPRKQSQVSAVQTHSRGAPTQESEHYAQVLERYNREKANAAAQSGDSYLSVMSSRANNVAAQPAPQPPVQAPAQAAYQPPSEQAGYYPQQPMQAAHQDMERSKDVAEQMQGLMANWAPTGHSLARTSTDAADYAKSLARPSASLQVWQGPVAANSKVVEDFALAPALLETDIDTDENSMVRASIPSGPYEGAELIALGYKRLTNTVDMTFTFMQWRGRSYKVTAKAVDQNSMRTALSGDVNNRYFSRIILPAISMGIGRAGQLYEQASTQTILSPLGGVIRTYPPKPSASAVAGTIVGGIGNQAGQVLANDAANMPVKQILIARGTTIGIQFVGPVTANDEVTASAGAPAQQGGLAVDPLGALNLPAAQWPRESQQRGLQDVGGEQGRQPSGQLQPYLQPGTPVSQ